MTPQTEQKKKKKVSDWVNAIVRRGTLPLDGQHPQISANLDASDKLIFRDIVSSRTNKSE